MEMNRKKFQGVLNIISFNRHFYAFGVSCLALIVGSQFVFDWDKNVFWLIVVGFVYGLTMPLIVSAYVYVF